MNRRWKKSGRKKVKRGLESGALFIGLLFFPILTGKAAGEDEGLLREYQAYEERFASIDHMEDLEENQYEVMNDQIFPVTLESIRSEELLLVPAIDRSLNRLALFFMDEEGQVAYRYNQLEANYRIAGELRQAVKDVSGVAFSDVNGDGLKDIILISRCENPTGSYAGIPYKVGDVIFQGEGSLYRDWRISDKINRFSMNKSTNQILFFVRDGVSTEFLYTATTLEELKEHGFSIFEDQQYTREFERLGRLQVVPGVFRMAWYDFFLIYLVNEQGEIVWSFQPMLDYDGLYSLKGINGRDVDGDGMKDLVVLARYSREDESGEKVVENICSIYYQRTSGFEADTGFENYYQYTEEDTMEDIIQKIREYWGWQVETDD
ncbi:VCBS repeat-containing protein [Candidatus Merdisoma sp. JLR.KK006]|uniref:VCBS repeat-containing protein n=1 Tax=Candidatus Merdisoma sp. JLR.KK006 TaxID=3112626 RepID=UPI002FEFCC11